MLPHNIIKLSYYQLGDQNLSIKYLKLKYANFYNEDMHMKQIKTQLKNAKVCSKQKVPSSYFSGHKQYTHTPEKGQNKPLINGSANYQVNSGNSAMNPNSNFYGNSNAAYQNLRHEEQRCAKMMVTFYQSAAQAYQRGDRSNVQKYKQLGDKYKKMYDNAKNNNASAMFDKVNQNLNRDEIIDLHGLHKEESVIALEERSSQIQARIHQGVLCRDHRLKIITGKGNNSRGGVPIIKPRVKEYLRENGLRMEELQDGGGFIVRIS